MAGLKGTTVTSGGGSYSLTRQEQELLPSAADVRSYAERGWYLSKKLLSDDEIDTLATAGLSFYTGQRDMSLPARPPHLSYWKPEHGDVQRHNDYIHYEVGAISRILQKSLLGAVAARLAQVNEIRLFQSTLIYKPPRSDEPSNIVPWHFDRDYWATCTSERMLTAFIPFHDCDEKAGTITMVDESHLWKDCHSSITSRGFMERGSQELDSALKQAMQLNNSECHKIPMVIPKGHVSFHHCRTYHGSGANHSGLPRRSISLHLQDGDNSYREFRLADGSLASYKHDVLVRRTPAGKPDYADPAFCPVLWRAGSLRERRRSATFRPA